MDENHPLLPNGAGYGASKAAADLLCYSAFVTFNQDVVRIRPFNQYGPYQACEKMIPKTISCLVEGKPIPVYGEGKATRDWVYVQDTVEAIWEARNLPAGEVVNIATGRDISLKQLTSALSEIHDRWRFLTQSPKAQIEFVEDRPGHVMRLCGDASKAEALLGWTPKTSWEIGIEKTYLWMVTNGKIMPPKLTREVPNEFVSKK